MAKKIIIIGAGMGGLSAGIYAQLNGYETEIFESHFLAGGQCTAWKRRGYTFDVCIHHLFGCNDTSKISRLWTELGALPREFVHIEDCVSYLSKEGVIYKDYYDIQKLESSLMEISSVDKKLIRQYISAIKRFKKNDMIGESMFGGKLFLLKTAPFAIRNSKFFKMTMQDFALKFKSPLLRKAFPQLEYSNPTVPFMVHLVKHGYGLNKSIAWPVGGALEFAKSIEKKYLSLGGKIHFNSKVARIIVENNKATGIELEDGSRHNADIVISNADGRKTILQLLENKYTNGEIKKWCEEPADEMNWCVHVFLGVNRDLSGEPSALVMELKKAEIIAGHENKTLEVQMYGFDKTLAPQGKGVIKVELVSGYSYWKKLSENKEEYSKEKEKIAEQIIAILEEHHFKGLKEQVEVIDVPTILTWEKYMGGTHGFSNFPNKKFNFNSILFNKFDDSLPGLKDFYFAGAWSTMTGALFTNAYSGRKLLQKICRQDGKKFRGAL